MLRMKAKSLQMLSKIDFWENLKYEFYKQDAENKPCTFKHISNCIK